MHPHWNNCITHFDDEVRSFIADYFARDDRRCLLVAGAGFDPRAQIIGKQLAEALGPHLTAIFIREERGDPAVNLRAAADSNEVMLRKLVTKASVVTVPIFGDDRAPVGGAHAVTQLRSIAWPEDVTDVVLDTSALSMGIAFPVARLMLALAARRPSVNMHIMVASNPSLDASIVGEIDDRAIAVRGFAGAAPLGMPAATIWLPQLARRAEPVLKKIHSAITDLYKVCPILPFPAENPRRADELITEFAQQFEDEWDVSSRDLIYVSERNPLDAYRTIATLKERYDRTVESVFQPRLVLSPIGSKVMAIGALMAAIDYDLTVQYVETLRYEVLSGPSGAGFAPDRLVHVWLDGPIYEGYPVAKSPTVTESSVKP